MSDLVRDAPIGQLIRWLTKNRVLQYPEEKADFTCPMDYQGEKRSLSDQSAPATSPPVAGDAAEKFEYPQTSSTQSLRHAPTALDVVTRPEMTKVHTRADIEEAYTNATRQETMKYQQSQPIVPEKTADGVILVDWYDTNDPENPQNWSGKKKGVVVVQIYLYTLAVYMG
jgi:DHA1 family multidrug resistance protein-like MFS transporter